MPAIRIDASQFGLLKVVLQQAVDETAGNLESPAKGKGRNLFPFRTGNDNAKRCLEWTATAIQGIEEIQDGDGHVRWVWHCVGRAADRAGYLENGRLKTCLEELRRGIPLVDIAAEMLLVGR